MRILFLFFSLVLLGFSYAPVTWAQCRVPSTSSSLGSASSITLNGASQTSQASTGFNCDAPTLSLAGTNRVIATFGTGNNASAGLRQLKHTTKSDVLPYTLCVDQNCNNILALNGSYTWSSQTLLGLLGLFTGPNSTLPLWVKTSTGAVLSAGTYTDVIAVNWDYRVCDVGIGELCLYYSGTPTSNITLTLTVTNDCQISNTNNIEFGSAAFPSAFTAINSSLGVRCTKDGAYSVALTSTHPDDANWRRMTASVSGTNYYLQYQLYRADNSAWTESNNYAGTGTGLTQTIPYTARINTSQANKPAGSYKDTVSVAVTIN
ncbi:spore coat protein U domain-containing protein [Candidatus Symbiopectobacterium sp. NZEC151]|uniref:Csu type fimbrial protein n=2 Tax=unclassified Symbiopectobacterium TaxID=2794573 RepID=UPI002227D652|nr:spore coat protein U domain-containing protein [Candidatus Symbiopectobacterium sp. NZEC151]MCW2475851.1 spore coat U domain-containing protein [Candidatus Symbiopectobacterium sp. NZEC151]